MYLSDYTAPPRKLKVGGGQDEGYAAAAARASCLPHVMEVFFLPPSKKLCSLFVIMVPLAHERPPANWKNWFPCDISLSVSGSVHAGYFTILLILLVFFSLDHDLSLSGIKVLCSFKNTEIARNYFTNSLIYFIKVMKVKSHWIVMLRI